ncbi:hypothetical protein [Sediminicola arcticus]|jgi:hypothetical protein|uniref:Anti-sigma factor n=1 Tax=Sediminicola arcticus TaxID=1574308 RepID=A0ABV2SWJ5_9FLAO
MAPMKFEEKMKEKLDQRTIRPSDKAWETIVSQLNSHKGSSRKNSLLWYGIAAGFTGIIFVSVIYFINQDPLPIDQFNVVDIEKLTVPTEKVPLGKSDAEQQMTLGSKENSVLKNEPKNTISNAVMNVKNSKKDYLNSRSNSDRAMDIAQQAKKENLSAQTNEVISGKIVQLVEQMELLEKNQMEVTNAEIDSLLRRAQQEIIQEQLFQKGKTVDAYALLTQVEGEMDQSFRDQIFDALREGFFKVRTAVASRNE